MTKVNFFDYETRPIDLRQPCFAYFTVALSNSAGITAVQRQNLRDAFEVYVDAFEIAFIQAGDTLPADTNLVAREFIKHARGYFAL